LAEIRAPAFHAQSIHDTHSFSEFRDLATESRTFEGEANVLGIVAALFTGQQTVIGPAFAANVKEVPAPIQIQIQFIRPPPSPSSDPRLVASADDCTSFFRKATWTALGIRSAIRPASFSRRWWRNSENICPRLQLERKTRPPTSLMLHILGDGVIEIDQCWDGSRHNLAQGLQFSEFRFPAGKIGGPFMRASSRRYDFRRACRAKRGMSDPALPKCRDCSRVRDWRR
jgi:hypothetical protein